MTVKLDQVGFQDILPIGSSISVPPLLLFFILYHVNARMPGKNESFIGIFTVIKLRPASAFKHQGQSGINGIHIHNSIINDKRTEEFQKFISKIDHTYGMNSIVFNTSAVLCVIFASRVMYM